MKSSGQTQPKSCDCGLCTYFSPREGTKPLVGQRREVSNSKQEIGVSWEEKEAPLREAREAQAVLRLHPKALASICEWQAKLSAFLEFTF